MERMTALRWWPRALRRVARYVLGRAMPPRLTPGERAFIEANTAFWRELDTGEARAGVVLVEPQFHPVILHSNTSFAAIVGRARGVAPVFMLESREQRRVQRLLSTYPRAGFVFLDSPRYLLPWLIAWFRALLTIRRWRTPADILQFESDGLLFGDVIYDAILAEAYATVDKVDSRALYALHGFYLYRSIVRDLLRRLPIRAYVSAHGYIGLRNGTFTRYLLRAGVEVLNRLGSHQIIVRKYRDARDIGTYALRPDPSYESILFDEHADDIAALADTYLARRFGQSIDDDLAADLAFDRRKTLFRAPEEFRRSHGLTNDAPIVFVMLHAFNDYPHSHFRRRLMFQDYHHWFVETLRLARETRDVNWIFKEHPAAEFYPTRDLDLEATFSAIDEPHIRFLGREADFNAASIAFIGHAIVTCIGTAGLEYSCAGIPCVLAGEAPYSGYGFTVEPADRTEYERVLRGIRWLSKLTPEQVRRAKAVLWFELSLLQEYEYFLCPRYTYEQIKRPDRVDFWGDVAALLVRLDDGRVRDELSHLTAFVESDRYVQLVNTREYPFLRAATGLTTVAS